LKWLLSASCWRGAFQCVPWGGNKGRRRFSSPDEASNALVTAAQNNDEEAMLDVLGLDGKQIVSSGDEIEDAQNRANFVQRYQEMHRLVKEPDGTIVLYIGAKNWPTPIPLVTKVVRGISTPMQARKRFCLGRIGRNEISTIRVCQELVAAEKEYHSAEHAEYAQKIFSDEGQHNGLYWKVLRANPRALSGRWWRQPLLRATPKTEMALRLRTAATTTTS